MFSVSAEVVQAAKTSVNFVFVAGCLTLTGAILYAIGDALFGSTSPYKVLSSSLEIIKKDEEVRYSYCTRYVSGFDIYSFADQSDIRRAY